MIMDEVIKISVIAGAAVLCAAVLKRSVPELALLVGIAGGAVILFELSGVLEPLKQLLGGLSAASGMEEEVLIPVWKAVGTAAVTKVTAELCRDAKENGVAAFVELAGSLLALTLAAPLIWAVFEGIGGLM